MTSAAKKAARGEEASRMAVNIWDVLYRSDQPLTFPQIADELTARGLRMNTDAMLWYIPHLEATGKAGTAAEYRKLYSNTTPPPGILDDAWRDYVQFKVREQCGSKRVTSTMGPGGNTKAEMRTYTANRDKPPMVYRTVITTTRSMVPYDPDFRDKANEAQTAGITFLQRYADLKQQKHLPVAKIRELLDLAEAAVRAKPAAG